MKKRIKFLDVAMLTSWCVGIFMIAVFLCMTTVYAQCDSYLCDNGVPKCSETKFIKVNENTPPGCRKSVSNGYAWGDCTNENITYCNTCACLPPSSTRLGENCMCRTPSEGVE